MDADAAVLFVLSSTLLRVVAEAGGVEADLWVVRGIMLLRVTCRQRGGQMGGWTSHRFCCCGDQRVLAVAKNGVDGERLQDASSCRQD